MANYTTTVKMVQLSKMHQQSKKVDHKSMKLIILIIIIIIHIYFRRCVQVPGPYKLWGAQKGHEYNKNYILYNSEI